MSHFGVFECKKTWKHDRFVFHCCIEKKVERNPFTPELPSPLPQVKSYGIRQSKIY